MTPYPRTAWPGNTSGRIDAKVEPAVAVEVVEPAVSITPAAIEALMKKADESGDLDEAAKGEVKTRLQGALEWLKTAEEVEAKVKEYQTEITNLPTDLQAAKTALAKPSSDTAIDVPHNATLAQVEQYLTEIETRLSQALDLLTKREESLKRRSERKAELNKLIAEAEERLEEARKLASADSSDSTLMDAARNAENKARLLAIEKQKALYPIELKRIDALAELLPLRRDLAKREVATLEKEVARWQQIVSEVRKRESDRLAAETRRQVQNAHPALKSFAERSAKYAEQRKAMIAAIEKIESEIQKSRQDAKQLKDDFGKITEKVEKAGHLTSTGFLLRRQRDRLPDVRDSRNRIRFVRQETPKIHLSALNLQEARDSLGDIDTAVDKVVAMIQSEIQQHEAAYIEQMVAELLQTRRDVLDNLIRDHDQYVNLLGELELSQRELVDQTEQFETFIDERVLWIRSSEVIGRSDVAAALSGLQHLAMPSKWGAAWQAIRARAAEQIWSVMLGIVSITLLILCRGRLRRQINQICKTDEPELAQRMLPTVEAIAALSLAAALWPGLMWLVGWQLTTARDMTDLGRACGVGLQSAAFALWIAKLVGQLFRRAGVVERHFEWNADALGLVRRHLVWLSLLGVPLVYFVSAIGVYHDGQWGSSLGRIGFLIGCILLLVFAHCTLRPNGGIFRHLSQTEGDAWYYRSRHTLYLLAIGVPLALGLFAALGYGYSAQRLAERLQTTVAIVLGVTLLRSLAIRWLSLRRERLIEAAALVDANPRSEANPDSLPVNEAVADNMSGDAIDEGLIEDDFHSDIEQSGAQVRYLLRYAVVTLLLVGGYWIWSDVTPALGVLNKVELWSKYVEIKETVPDADGTTKLVTTPKKVSTTLKHAILAGFTVLLGLVLARNLPGLLDVLVLERMPLDKGQRYAAGMILRYVVTLGGLIIACQELGFTWSKIQWLAAAMTVGLGFGLQEIFANLVSGLIILFERPVRVGDLVTVGGVTGRVTRMQIRATTVTDFDRRELIVPNKKFITEDVMNWTLTDNINRVVVEVGVAYGSDTPRVRALMLRVARRHPLVLAEPEPSVTFDKFMDSSLNFTLRCFLPSLDNRLAVIHELHAEIDREFRRANIEIAFPQQDLHIRTIDAPLMGGEQPQNDAA